MTTNILTADEFIAQGTTAGAIMSIALVNPEYRGALQHIARQVADRTGQTLQIPGALTQARAEGRRPTGERRRPANDNGRNGRRVAA